MSKRKVEKVSIGQSVLAERIEQLRKVMPEAFSEGKVDLDKMREALGDAVDDRPERYSFTWAGKRDAIRMLQQQSRATLRPARSESVNFDATQHVFIEGDNLEALKLMFKPYFGRVKMIYIDPPYNTGNDFIYPDNFADPLDTYLRLTGQKDSEGNVLTSNPESNGRYHSAWLSMMFPRLFLARQLLSPEGVIFVSIDDHEVHNLKALLNEVFGEENFVACIIWKKMDSPSRNDENRAVTDYHDYILLYARDKTMAGLRQKAKPEILRQYPLRLPDGRLARARQMRKNGKGARRQDRPSMWYSLTAPDGSELWPIAPEGWEGRWVLSRKTWEDRVAAGLAKWEKRSYGWMPYYIEIAPKNPTVPWPTLWTEVDQNRQAKAKFTELMGSGVEFTNPKPCDILMDMMRLSTQPDDTVVDFFAGSCSTADAVLQLNREDGGSRRFIMVQIPEPSINKELPTIADLGKERIRRRIVRLEADKEGILDIEERDNAEDLGLRVFALSESSFRQWVGVENNDPEKYAETLALFNDPLLPGWKPEDVIWEVALNEGYPLHSRIEKDESAKDLAVYHVTDPDREQSFRITLDAKVTLAAVKPLGLKKGELFICRDVALDDETAANLALQCHLKTI